MFEMNGDTDKKKNKKMKKKEKMEGMKKEIDIVSKVEIFRINPSLTSIKLQTSCWRNDLD